MGTDAAETTTTDEAIHLEGHATHVKRATDRGLPGEMPRPVKVTIIGAGSMFSSEICNDLLRMPGNQGGTIALVDIDGERLELMRRTLEVMVAFHHADHWTIEASTDRATLLPGTDYIVNCIEVSGLDCVRFDNDIPARYGVDQCIGDTIGPGGLFKALRTVPVWLEVLADAERLCPEAWVLNYTNPMNMMCLASGRTSSMTVVGLCHSVQGTSNLLAQRAGVRYRDLVWECAGINHLAWFTRLEANGEDLYPALMAKARADLAGNPSDPDDAGDLVRKDMMVHFGAFITESSGHLSEYVPYYRARAQDREQWSGPEYDGESGFYAREWPKWREALDVVREAMLRGEWDLDWPRSWEYATWIIEAREKDQPYRFHGNVMNGPAPLITNLPADGCVEVACWVDRAGIHPTRFGPLPRQMAAICAADMRCFDLGAQAAIERRRDLATWALMVDPLTSACCTPSQIQAMADELFEAEAAWLPGFA